MRTQPDPEAPFLRAAASTSRLSRNQIVASAALGLFFWFLAAMFIRYAVPAGLFGGAAGAVLFAVTIPATWLLVWTMKRVAGLMRDQIVTGVVIATALATVCDGIALTWLPGLYGDDPAGLLPAAAWLLFGVGAGLVFALLAARSADP